MNYTTKKLITFSCGLFLSLVLVAQNVTSAGNFMIGTTLGFSTASSETEINSQSQDIKSQNTEALQLSFTPKLGYFVMDNWTLGLAVDYTLSRLEEPINVLDPDTEFNISYDSDLLFGPFTRFYFLFGEDKALFIESTLGFGSSRNQIQVDGGEQTISNNVLTFGVGPGFTIFSDDGIGVSAIAKYNWARANADVNVQGIRSETMNITNAFDLSIGFQVYFSRIARAGTSTRTRTNTDFYRG
ncbi:MAG: hypothetical protein D6772_07760 [Bacteroidetes bacterium]|nr:MAG: hypothetical protein D6772_07760 [Bacteroidota bacterium]